MTNSPVGGEVFPHELALAIDMKCDQLLGLALPTSQGVATLLREVQPAKQQLRLLLGLVINQSTGVLIAMGNTTTVKLTNAANPAQSTFYAGIIDVSGGTALPTLAVTQGNAALINIVPAPSLGFGGLNPDQFLFNVYPVDEQDETDDLVYVTATLPDGQTLPFVFDLSGTGETMALDNYSAVQTWSGAPTVPAQPVAPGSSQAQAQAKTEKKAT